MENKLFRDYIPLNPNGESIHVLNEHCGEILLLKWNQNKKYLATGGSGDNYVNVWDFGQLSKMSTDDLNPGNQTTSPSSPKIQLPIAQLRHINALTNGPNQEPNRSDENYFISSIQWSTSGKYILTSAYDNIARVWDIKGDLKGLIKSENALMTASWNKSDTLIGSGGEDTGLFVWDPFKAQHKPLYKLDMPACIIDIAW